MSERLRDRIAIVTGAAVGSGRAIAQRFLAEGARVVLLDLPGSPVTATAEELDARGESTLPLRGDVTCVEDVQETIRAAVARFGSIDILVNNAGICPMGPFLETELATHDQVMAVNVRGSFMMARACAREMVRRQTGCIVQLSSTFAFASGAVRDFCVYNMSKAAVRQMVHGLAAELAPYQIRVNAVAPGSIDTQMFRACLPSEEALAAQARRIPLRRLGRPEDVAGACVFLCSDDAAYITGHTLVVDGGWLLR